MDDTTTRRLQVLDQGLLEYGESLKLQEALVSERIAGISQDRLVLVEHPPVVTVGRSGKPVDLLLGEDKLREKGASLFHVDRGGMTTFHGPGQLVAYPVIRLVEKDLHLYLEKLLSAVASVVREYGMVPEIGLRGPGIWVGGAKIASVGIAARKWVTYHGIALNVNTDVNWFKTINPCGYADEKITSMQLELGYRLDLGEVKSEFVKAFCRVFEYPEGPEVHQFLRKRPSWLTLPAPCPDTVDRMESLLRSLELGTVCQSAQCPNLGECFGRGTATFLILGDTCTRACRFCAVRKGVPARVDEKEPEHVAEAVASLGISHAVITSVTRDDLPDGGSKQFVRTIEAIRRRCPGVKVEVLVPDFQGSHHAVQAVMDAGPEVFNHNVETVARLYRLVRPQARYERSLRILEYAAQQGLTVKSGIMLGLGEREREILDTLSDLKLTGCSHLTIGQYLSPSNNHLPIARYVSPEEFERWAATSRFMGFREVASGPLVRSSYRAGEMAADSGRGMIHGRE